ncbi:formylglycine-generating enzyme family protein [Gimesia fumaroli]|uniref:Serine/threonine-protein kinase pkn1 n=1 Tax=Gimesia fumaroli TaxID=2527976 RepID=A0A518I8A7_9PLAN|nr:formylglycine-generating enzyme family protein [Gimesia fumaroli]QDV49289.1 Serine/threonine-protein kinase pkn1 [Gimesia fumaroli]
MSGAFNPYHKWLGIPAEKCPPTYYDLLRISVGEQSRDVIQMAVERQKSHLEQFRVGKHARQVAKIIYELEEAELTLLNRELRQEYDERVVSVRERKNKKAGSLPSVDGNQETAGEGSGLLSQYLGIVSILAVSFSVMAASVYFIPWKKIGNDGAGVAEQRAPQEEAMPAGGEQDANSQPQAAPDDSDRPALLVSPFSQQDAAARRQEWAQYLKQTSEETNSLGLKLVLIPAGEFQMGNTQAEVDLVIAAMQAQNINVTDSHAARVNSAMPQHQVVINQPFMMSQQEITQSMFRAFINETGYQTDAQKDGKGGYAYEDDELVQSPDYLWNTNYGLDQPEMAPVVNVSWNDASEFCKWLSQKEGKKYRLPTEAEWEYACRAGTTTMFSFGNALTEPETETAKEYAWFINNTSQVGEFYPQAVMTRKPNPFGLFDMHGNVYEWCQDWYNETYYRTLAGQKAVDPTGPATDQSVRVIRGGSWFRGVLDIRAAYRDRIVSENRNLNVGFRVVCEVQ